MVDRGRGGKGLGGLSWCGCSGGRRGGRGWLILGVSVSCGMEGGGGSGEGKVKVRPKTPAPIMRMDFGAGSWVVGIGRSMGGVAIVEMRWRELKETNLRMSDYINS